MSKYKHRQIQTLKARITKHQELVKHPPKHRKKASIFKKGSK